MSLHWSRIGWLPWPLLWHTAGTPESTAHRRVRVFLSRTHSFWTWKVPKWLGLDICTECGETPCGTKIGGEWRCPVHSVFVAKGNGAAEPGAALRVLKGGKR